MQRIIFVMVFALSIATTASAQSQSGGLPELQQGLAALSSLVSTLQQQVHALQQQAAPVGPPFSNASLQGTYLFEYRGHSLDYITLLDVGVPLMQPPFLGAFPIETARSARAVVAFDGAGNWTILAGACSGERILPVPSGPNLYGPAPVGGAFAGSLTDLSGTYAINGDGSGVINLPANLFVIAPPGVILLGPDCALGPVRSFDVQVSPAGNATLSGQGTITNTNTGAVTIFGINGVLMK